MWWIWKIEIWSEELLDGCQTWFDSFKTSWAEKREEKQWRQTTKQTARTKRRTKQAANGTAAPGGRARLRRAEAYQNGFKDLVPSPSRFPTVNDTVNYFYTSDYTSCDSAVYIPQYAIKTIAHCINWEA